MTKFIKSLFTISFWTSISRMLGLVRDILFATVVGAGTIADAFFVAFRFPNVFRALFAEGVMNSAFVPIFTKEKMKSKKNATDFVTRISTLMFIWMILFSILIMFFAKEIMSILAIGYIDNKDKFNLTVKLSQIMFPFLGLMVMNSIFSATLNSLKKFAIPAFMPILLNLFIITTLSLIYLDFLKLTGYEIALSVLIAGASQFIILFIFLVKEGIYPTFNKIKINKKVKSFFKLSLPVIFGSSVLQINILIGTLLASTLKEGSISFLYYADRLSQLPLGVIGVAINIILLPSLVKKIVENKQKEINNEQNYAITIGMLITIPAAFGLFVLSDELINGIFGYGNFNNFESINATSNALKAMAISVPAYVLIKIITPAFFARKDTQTPVKIGIFCVVINILLGIILMQYFFHVGLAIATSISAWINFLILFTLTLKKNYLTITKNTYIALIKILIACVIMTIVIAVCKSTTINLFNNKLTYMIILTLIGFFSYVIFYLSLKIKKIKK